jgi:hypothetical protein
MMTVLLFSAALLAVYWIGMLLVYVAICWCHDVYEAWREVRNGRNQDL